MGTELHKGRLTTADDVRKFVYAGNARFTLVGQRLNLRGERLRFTYKVVAKKDGSVFFVSYLAGPDNSSQFHYLGVLDDRGGFHWSPKSRCGDMATCFKAFRWFVNNFHKPEQLAKVEVWTEGQCCRCGKALTVPSSVAGSLVNGGFGPECVKYREAA